MHGGSEENKEKWDKSFSRARATRKKLGQRAPPPLHRTSDGKSCLDFLTFNIYRCAKCTFKVNPGYAFRGSVYHLTFISRIIFGCINSRSIPIRVKGNELQCLLSTSDGATVATLSRPWLTSVRRRCLIGWRDDCFDLKLRGWCVVAYEDRLRVFYKN